MGGTEPDREAAVSSSLRSESPPSHPQIWGVAVWLFAVISKGYTGSGFLGLLP